MIPKSKKERRKGKAKSDLVREAYDRDNENCVVCGAYVPEGSPPAHCPDKSQGGQDRIEDVFTICPPGSGNECHLVQHFSKDAEQKRKVEQALWWYKLSLYCKNIDSDHCKECDNPRCECSPYYDRNWKFNYGRGEDLNG